MVSTLFLKVAIFFLFVASVNNAFTIISSHPPYAQITGRVVDKKTQQPIPYAEVFIKSLQQGDVTNEAGEFSIDKIPSGTYVVILRRQGYKTLHKKNTVVEAGRTFELVAELEPSVLEMDGLVVTATRHADSEHELAQMVSIVTVQEIRQKNINQTPELLREESGVFVQKTNQGGGSPIIRGLKANKLLLLVDGIRMNNSTYRGGNVQYLNTIDANLLERVEVVHGPGSALYGSDALGGVINIITKSPPLHHGENYDWRFVTSGLFSTADDSRLSHLGLSVSHSKWALRLDASYKSYGDITRGSSGGDELMQRLRNDSRTERVLSKKQAPNGYNAIDFSTKTLFKLSDHQSVTMSYQLNRQDKVPRYDVVEVLSDSIRLFDPQKRDLFYLTYRNNQHSTLFDFATTTLSLHRQSENRIRQKFGSVNQTRDQYQTLTYGAQLQLNKILMQQYHLVYGAEFYYDEVSSESSSLNTATNALSPGQTLFPDGSTYLSFGSFAQGEFNFVNRWALTGGVRFSAFKLEAPFESETSAGFSLGTVEQSFSTLTASLGSRFEIANGINFTTNLAQGFRAPNLDDASKLGPGKGSSFFDVPNSNLGPEKSLSIDAGIKLNFDSFRMSAVAYYNDITDLLVRQPATFNGSSFVIDEGDTLLVFHKENAGDAFTAGFAVSGEGLLRSNIALFGNLSYTYGQNQTDDEPLSGVPPLHGLAGLRWRTPKTWAEFNLRFAGEQDRLALEDLEDLRIPEGGTPGWVTLNLRAGKELTASLLLKLAITNLLDRNYREHLSGFNAPGRNFVLGGELNF